MNFVSIDFETADQFRHSPCQIGLTYVEDGMKVGVETFFIKPPCYPYFDDFNISIHGITPQDVADSPSFDELWPDLESKLSNRLIIAHNASFDLSVLRQTLDHYGLEYPELRFLCTHRLSKLTWPEVGYYSLSYLHDRFRLGLDKHHDAGQDSKAAANLALEIFRKLNIDTLSDIDEVLGIQIGQMKPGTYQAFAKIREHKSRLEKYGEVGFSEDDSNFNPESIFFGKTVAFTGALMSMTRKEAIAKVREIGAAAGLNLTKQTNFLVCGYNDKRVVGPEGLSSKERKAIKYAEEGQDIEIIDEDEFLNNL